MNQFALDGLGAVAGQVDNQAILAWAFDQALPGQPIGGVVTGRVLRTVWIPGAAVPTFVPVAGALMSGVDGAGQPLFAGSAGTGAPTPLVAVSQADGTYALFDPRYKGGTVTVSATFGGTTIRAVAWEANPEDTKSPGLRFARHIATANLTYPADQPPQPATAIKLTLTHTVEGVEQPLRDGVVIAGTPIGAHITPSTSETRITGVSINGQPVGVQVDGTTPGRWVLNSAYVPAQPGLYTIVATAQPTVGAAITATTILRAIAAGGGVIDPLPSDAPIVVEGRTVPKRNATGVAASIFPQVTFSEPVTNVPAGAAFTDESGTAVPFTLFGVGP